MKWIKRFLAILVTIVLAILVLIIALDEEVPSGIEGEKAEKLVDLMLTATNIDAWEKTRAISWNFGGRHHHLWDRDRHLAKVSWGDFEVLIDINGRRGKVIKGYEGDEKEKLSDLCLTAWKYWANDSFWLNPVAKLRDPGTMRYLVDYRGNDALLIRYGEGGVTPGDSYLWLVDETGLPYEWKMWVKIIPIGGVSTTWEEWIELPTGAKVATTHYNLLTLKLEDIQAAYSLDELINEDIFRDLLVGDGVVSF